MRSSLLKILAGMAILAGGLSLGGCDTLGQMPGLSPATSSTQPSLTDPSALTPAEAANAATADNQDELSLGKRHFRAGDYGLAEKHFRKAVELHPNDAEGWLGLAAAYDELRRFDLADRAYMQAIKIAGPTPAILNNRGYSYMLRGDLVRARKDLETARAASPQDPRVIANLQALDARTGRR
jgi:Flp pilus assembly protein TadD